MHRNSNQLMPYDLSKLTDPRLTLGLPFLIFESPMAEELCSLLPSLYRGEMKNSNTCPKCGGTKIAGSHNVHAGDMHIRVNLPGFSTATVDSYTCANCGYTEFYSDSLGLKNIRRSGRFRQRPEHLRRHECPVCRTIIPYGISRCPECWT